MEIARERITALLATYNSSYLQITLTIFVDIEPYIFLNPFTIFFLNICRYIWTRQTEQLIYSFDQFEKSDSTYLLPFSFSKK